MSRTYLSPPDPGRDERDRLLSAFDSGWMSARGEHIDAFEREVAAYVGVPHAVALSSGTAALHLSLAVLGIGRGDVVLTSMMTFAATVNAIAYVGATPVLVDVSPETWTIDPDLVEQELHARAARGRQASVVLAVDIFGQCADYARLVAVCRRFGVPLVEDAAQALGSTCGDAKAGAFGECAAVSFNGNKIITTGAGGMLLTQRDDLAVRARSLAAQGREAGAYYRHVEVGYNYQMNNLLAAIGRGQLPSLPARVARRQAINAEYRRRLGGIAGLHFMPEAPYGRGNCWLTSLTVAPDEFGASRDDIALALESEDIESRPFWAPMHQQPAFLSCPRVGGPVAERLSEHGLSLPSGANLTDAELSRCADVVRAVPDCCCQEIGP